MARRPSRPGLCASCYNPVSLCNPLLHIPFPCQTPPPPFQTRRWPPAAAGAQPSQPGPGAAAGLPAQELSDKFLGKKFCNSMKTGKKQIFHPFLLLLFLDPGSEIRDPEWVKIRIRDKHPGSATLPGRIRIQTDP